MILVLLRLVVLVAALALPETAKVGAQLLASGSNSLDNISNGIKSLQDKLATASLIPLEILSRLYSSSV